MNQIVSFCVQKMILWFHGIFKKKSSITSRDLNINEYILIKVHFVCDLGGFKGFLFYKARIIGLLNAEIA